MEIKIEKIIKHEKKKNKYLIYLEDGSCHELVSEILLKFGLRSGDLVDEKKLIEIFQQAKLFEARNSALRMLAKRMRTEKEIIDKLKTKGHDEYVIDTIINDLKRINLINDDDFTERYINDSITLKKPYGKFALMHKMQKFGLNKNKVSEKLGSMISDEDETALAVSLVKKKLPTLEKFDVHKKKQRIANFLAGRGFSWDTIRKVFDDLKIENGE